MINIFSISEKSLNSDNRLWTIGEVCELNFAFYYDFLIKLDALLCWENEYGNKLVPHFRVKKWNPDIQEDGKEIAG